MQAIEPDRHTARQGLGNPAGVMKGLGGSRGGD
jgi:hypothetical protein